MEKITDVIAQMKASKSERARAAVVKDWRSMIPSWSRWSPGMRGKPDCKSCLGIGYVRLDLPVGHPKFGDLFECECVK